MPEIKPRHLKSLISIDQEPQRVTPKMITIIYMDLAGKGTSKIATELGMTQSRISIIKGSPMYKERRDSVALELKEQFLNDTSKKLTTDPVLDIYRAAAVDAAKEHVALMKGGNSEFVRMSAADRVVDRSGYKIEKSDRPIEVKVENKIFNRFIEVAKHAARPSDDDGRATGGSEETVS